MPEVAETIYAPELNGGQWIQGGPVSIRALKGTAVVLVDFWDYTCVNCIRTLPYVAEWHRRYAPNGLKIVGVHAPEFNFARDGAFVAQAIKQFQLEYPIVLDNDYAIWRAYSNRFWPAKYLIDALGRIRYVHFGEGGYAESETFIQRLLRELNANAVLPPVMDPVRDTDRPGAVCYRVTPELYAGYARGQFGNAQGITRDRGHRYRDPGHYAEGFIYLDGMWQVREEYASAVEPGAALSIRFTGQDVNLVLTPPPSGVVNAELTLDKDQQPGGDVKIENGRAIVMVDRARMYNLISNSTVKSGALRLAAIEAGLNAYAFTFTSCVLDRLAG